MSSTEEMEAKPKPEGTDPPAQDSAEGTETEPKQQPSEVQSPSEKQPQGEEPQGEVEEEEEPDDGVPRVLVTGASGYIALHVTKLLLEDGRFRVRGSVRNKKNKEKIQPLLDLVPDAKYPLRLVEGDLMKPESWKAAVKSCSYVFHLASPFPPPSQAVTDNMLVTPAVEGTLSVLRACVEAGTVKRVVLTSSVAAISNGLSGVPGKPADHVYSESDWSDEATCKPYPKSKLKAEQAAWDFVKNLDEDKKFELVVVNPGYVQGPLLSPVGGDGTKVLCAKLLNKNLPAIPDLTFSCVDVRDVATANIAAMEKPEAVGNRYILVAGPLNYREIARMVAEEFRPQGYKITMTPLPKAAMWFVRLFDSDARATYPLLGKIIHYNNEKMVRELGVTPRDTKQMILDTCYSLIELGLVKKTPRYLGPPSARPPPVTEQPPASDTTAGQPAESAPSKSEGQEEMNKTESQGATEEEKSPQ